MKKWLLLMLLTGVTTLGFADTSLPSPENSLKPIDQVVAVVNDDVVTQSEINSAYKNAMQQLKAHNAQIPDASTLKNEILNQIIYHKLQIQVAKRNNISVTNEQVTMAIEGIAKQNHLSVAEMKSKIIASGMTFAKYREEIKNQVMLSMIQHEALSKDIKVSNAEVREFFNKVNAQKDFAQQYNLIDILIALPSAPTASQLKQAKAQAMEISKQLKAGAATDSIKGADARELGWQASNQLPDIFIEAINNQSTGYVSQPLKAGNGFHVIKLLGTKAGEKKLPTEQQAKQILLQQKYQAALHKWVENLRKQSFVKIVKPQ